MFVVNLLKDHSDPGKFSAISAVSSACNDSGSEHDHQEEPYVSLGE